MSSREMCNNVPIFGAISCGFRITNITVVCGSARNPTFRRLGWLASLDNYVQVHSRISYLSLDENSAPLTPHTLFSLADEEIDVVTVTSADRSKASRKRSHPSSLSAPCSRQTSPHPPQKRRKYHTKR